MTQVGINLCNVFSSMIHPKYIYHIVENEISNSIWIMHKNGIAFCRIYWFNDDDNSIYFDNLSVNENERNKGVATILLNTFIELASNLGLKSFLWVKKDTWMRDWYIRKGFRFYQNYEKEDNAIWMIK